MAPVVGIDLGTTYSAIAYVNRYGRAEVIPNREGEDITPSVVLLEDPPIVGTSAKHTAVERPLDTVQFVKRFMGDPTWRFHANNREYAPEDISAIILKRLVDDAATTIGEPITQAVISVPAYFDDARRKATQDAGKIAGLDVMRIINEPTAAALAFGIDFNQAGCIAVYDLGGGTFDVTIMQVDGDDLRVLATDGDRQLGGFDWDNRMMKLLDDQFVASGGLSHFGNPHAEQDLREKAEAAKKALSLRDEANVFLTSSGKSQRITVTRDEFEKATADLLERTERILEFVREDAKLPWNQINRVLLVGGSTRMPAVMDLVARVTGKRPSSDVHPDKAVALGAAIQGNLLAQAQAPDVPQVRDAAGNLIKVKVQDVTSHGLGIAAVTDPQQPTLLRNSIIIERNSPVPSRNSDVYYTMQPNQRAWQAQVTEGDDEDLEFVTTIGQATISIPPYPGQAPFEVTFEYDHDGIVHMYVRDMSTGQHIGELHIDRAANLTDAEIDGKRDELSGVSPD